jgi:hypothetical protein
LSIATIRPVPELVALAAAKTVCGIIVLTPSAAIDDVSSTNMLVALNPLKYGWKLW